MRKVLWVGLVLAGTAWANDARWQQLRSPQAIATSFLRSNWNKYTENYHPSFVLDEDPKTAWVEGADGNGERETLTLPVSSLSSARAVKLRIRNGYQKSDALLLANAAPKDVRVTLQDARGGTVASVEHTLERRMDWQELVIDVPDGRGFSHVTLEILTVHPGKTYKDTCISDVLVFVDTDVPYEAEVEQRKHDALKAWVRTRAETAAYFASKPPELPFAFTHFDRDESEVEVAAVEAALAGPRKELAALKQQTKWYRGDLTRPALPMPDGTWILEDVQRLLRVQDLAFFESPNELGKHENQEGLSWSAEVWWSNYKIAWAEGATPRPSQLYFNHRSVTEERGTYERKFEHVVRYDEHGRITSWYSVGTTNDELGPIPRERLVTFTYDAAGKIIGFEERELAGVPEFVKLQGGDATPRASATVYRGS